VEVTWLVSQGTELEDSLCLRDGQGAVMVRRALVGPNRDDRDTLEIPELVRQR
jgi:hypothetical protein